MRLAFQCMAFKISETSGDLLVVSSALGVGQHPIQLFREHIVKTNASMQHLAQTSTLPLPSPASHYHHSYL